ncbi:hypothetical protein EPO04_00265 [Patescibacteria group bacterium]|nr:MAG: hypothetical protein EPO04_00265 [Patescibacteria group bacterium]
MALTTEDKTYIDASVKKIIDHALEEFAISINNSFQAMHQRFDLLEIRVGNLETRMSKTEARLEEMDRRLGHKVDLLFDAISYRSEEAAVESQAQTA